MSVTSQQRATLAHLRQQMRQLETESRPQEPAISTGCEALDRLLPAAGLQGGTITEWIGAAGSSAGWLACVAAASAVRQRGGRVVVLDAEAELYPPIFFAAGVPADQIVIVRPKHEPDVLWAIDQALRCPAVAAVWAPLGKIDGRQQRRLQLAAEMGGGLGLFVRPTFCLPEPSWAELRLHVTPQAVCVAPAPSEPPAATRLVQVRIARCRGGRSGAELLLELEEATGRMRAVGPTLDHGSVQKRRAPSTVAGHKAETLRKRFTREADDAASSLHLAAELANPAALRRRRRTA